MKRLLIYLTSKLIQVGSDFKSEYRTSKVSVKSSLLPTLHNSGQKSVRNDLFKQDFSRVQELIKTKVSTEKIENDPKTVIKRECKREREKGWGMGDWTKI